MLCRVTVPSRYTRTSKRNEPTEERKKKCFPPIHRLPSISKQRAFSLHNCRKGYPTLTFQEFHGISAHLDTILLQLLSITLSLLSCPLLESPRLLLHLLSRNLSSLQPPALEGASDGVLFTLATHWPCVGILHQCKGKNFLLKE